MLHPATSMEGVGKVDPEVQRRPDPRRLSQRGLNFRNDEGECVRTRVIFSGQFDFCCACDSDVLRRAEYGGERVIVERHGKPVAAIVSTDDLRRLEATDDAADLRDAQAALAEAKHAGTVPLNTVLQKYGLDHLLAGPAPRKRRPHAAKRTRVSAKRSRKTSTDRRRR